MGTSALRESASNGTVSRTKHRARISSPVNWASSLVLLAVLWIIFVGGTRTDEMITGVGVLLLSGGFLYLVARTETLELDFHFQDLIQGWRIPWYVVSGIAEIVLVFVKDVTGIKSADSFYRVSGFKASRGDRRLVARRVLAIFYTTMAPNFIVIGVDERQHRMLFHQLERSSVPLMTQALGAEAGGKRR